MKVNIYDMDGTIVDSMHRYRTITENGNTRIDLDHWRANEHRAMQDSLLPLAKQYQADLLDSDTYVIITTARVLNEPDMQFINHVLGRPNHIISRKHGDNQSGKTLKINGLTKFYNLPQFKKAVSVFYEDNVSYLKAVCDKFMITGVYVPSGQGH